MPDIPPTIYWISFALASVSFAYHVARIIVVNVFAYREIMDLKSTVRDYVQSWGQLSGQVDIIEPYGHNAIEGYKLMAEPKDRDPVLWDMEHVRALLSRVEDLRKSYFLAGLVSGRVSTMSAGSAYAAIRLLRHGDVPVAPEQ